MKYAVWIGNALIFAAIFFVLLFIPQSILHYFGVAAISYVLTYVIDT